jgi:hypothetical protein
LVRVVGNGFGGKGGFRGFVEIGDALMERPAIDLVFVEGVELVDGAEVFAQDAVGMFLGPLIELENDVAILDVFGEPEFLLVRDEEDGEKSVIGNTLIEKTFSHSSVGFAAFEDKDAGNQKLAGGGVDEIAVGENGVFGEEFLFGGGPVRDRRIETLVSIWIREIPGVVITGFNENFHHILRVFILTRNVYINYGFDFEQ